MYCCVLDGNKIYNYLSSINLCVCVCNAGARSRYAW